MANNIKNVWVGLRFRPVSTLTTDKLGEVQAFSTDSKTYLHNGTTRSPLVTESHAATLLNKTIDANGTGNSISNLETADLAAGVLNTSTTLAGATNTQIPSALAVKTYVDNTFTPQTEVDNLVTLTGVPANSTDLGTFTGTTIPDASTIKGALQSLETGLEAHIADTVDAHDASAISNIPSGNLAATDVQAALNELQTDIDTRALDSALQAHINDTVDAHDASSISVVPFPGIVSTDVQSALVELEGQITAGGNGDVVGPASATDNAIARFDTTTGKLIQNSVVTVSDTGVVAGSSIDAATNTLTNITNTSIAAAASVVRTKLASGTNYRILANNATGVMSENAALTSTRVTFADTNGQLTDASDLTVTTNALTLANTKHLEVQAATDSTTTGSNASLATFNAGAIRLTNASLVSLANIPAGTNGQKLTIFNRTGVDVTIPDSSAAVGTAANRILTGTNATTTFTNNASLALEYDSTTARWQIVGGTGSGTGTSSLDTILQLTASEQLTDWSTGDNATFLGGGTLSGTFVKDTTTPLHGTASYKYTQAAGSLDDYLASAAFPVDIRFRATQVYLSFPFKYDGATGDIQIIVYDATNSTIISTSADVIQGTNNANQTAIVGVLIPSTCASVRVGFQTKVLNSGKILQFDDIQLSSSLYQSAQLNNVTEWTSAGLVAADFVGFGTPTSINIFSRRNGSNLEVRGSFISGTSTATQARMNLRLAGVLLTSASTSAMAALQKAGSFTQNAPLTGNGIVLSENGVSYLTFGYETGSVSGMVESNGSTFISSGTTQTIEAVVPIQGWSAGSTAIVTPTQQISSDTLPFTFKATAIVDADPIGTFNTYTYAINTNTATISASAPTQTVASMGTNGVQLFGRAYNAASTTASPARFDIKIGKGLKAHQVDAYTTTGKTGLLVYDLVQFNATSFFGSSILYEDSTGILRIEAALNPITGTTTRAVGYDSAVSASANGYFVFNASTTPSITALPVLAPRIATLSDVKASGTAGGSASAATTATRTLNTIVDTYGVVTSLVANQFILSRGRYFIEASAPGFAVGTHKARIRNITDSTTALIGTSEITSSAVSVCTRSFVSGEVTITSAKTFELQHFTTTASATVGQGNAVSSGESETYSIVQITKISDL